MARTPSWWSARWIVFARNVHEMNSQIPGKLHSGDPSYFSPAGRGPSALCSSQNDDSSIVARYRLEQPLEAQRQSCCFKRSKMSFKAGPLTNDSSERRLRDSDVVRNSLAKKFWLTENILVTFEPNKITTPIRQARKLPRSSRTDGCN